MTTFYKIYCIEEPSIFYIGSTNNFSRRKSHHKKNVNNKRGKLYWTKLYSVIREKGGWDKFEMTILYTKDDEIENRYLEEEAIKSILQPPLNVNCCSCIKPDEEFLNKINNLFKEKNIL